MLDLSHLGNKRDAYSQIFRPMGLASATLGNWQVWNKPLGITTVQMLCIGSGASGAGGNGRASLAASIAAGGGGGGCSGYTSLIIPAALVTDQLFISVGPGPLGGATSAAGLIGINSYISAAQGVITAASLYLSANTNNPAAPAAAGTTGVAGAAGTIALITGMQLAYGGIFSATVSIAGGAGSVGAADAVAVVAMTNSMLCGGAGGGGSPSASNTNRVGGAITGAGLVPGLPGGVVAGGNGTPGFQRIAGLCASGGTGGGSNAAAGVGGSGGSGGIGCGGGGGGNGLVGSAGVGGSGGDGMIVITCW